MNHNSWWKNIVSSLFKNYPTSTPKLGNPIINHKRDRLLLACVKWHDHVFSYINNLFTFEQHDTVIPIKWPKGVHLDNDIQNIIIWNRIVYKNKNKLISTAKEYWMNDESINKNTGSL